MSEEDKNPDNVEESVEKETVKEAVTQEEKEAEEKLKGYLKEDIDKVTETIKNRGKHKFSPSEPYDIKYKMGDDDLSVSVTNAFNDMTYKNVLSALSLNKVPSADMKHWMEILSESSSSNTFDEVLAGSLEKGNWLQGVESEAGLIAPSRPVVKKPSNAVISGDDAVNLAIEATGGGKLIQIPLMHSGFWVTIKPPPKTDIITMFEQIEAEEESIGRSSYGFIYSNSRGIYTKIMCELALSLVVSTTKQLSQGDTNTLTLDDIAMNDAPMLQAGILMALWFQGMPYRRACVPEEGSCTFVHEGKLDISKLYWVNADALTDKQLAHMAKRSSGSMSYESIERYKEGLINSQDKVRELSENISVKLKSPTIADNITATMRWMTDISTILQKSVALDSTPQGKEKFRLKASQGSSTRQFSHYVKEVIVYSNPVRDQDGIDKIVSDVISSDDELAEKFHKSITGYIEDSTIAMYAIPSFTCPTCGTDTGSDSDRMFGLDWLFPLDMSVLLSHGLSLIYLQIE